MRLGFGSRYSDLCYGFLAFWADVLPHLDGEYTGFEVETLIHIRALRASLSVAEVPSFESPRRFGVSNLRTDPGRRARPALHHDRMDRAPRDRSPDDAGGGDAAAGPSGTPAVPVRGAEPGRGVTDGMPTVTVVVCCYTLDRWDDLGAALTSLREQRHPADEIVVVVDHEPALAAATRRRAPGPDRRREPRPARAVGRAQRGRDGGDR